MSDRTLNQLKQAHTELHQIVNSKIHSGNIQQRKIQVVRVISLLVASLIME